MEPQYINRESEFAIDVPTGTKVRASWGAMFPEDRGTVIGFDPDKGYLIDWVESENMSGQSYYGIRATRSANGSGIGVWIDG